LEFGVTILQQQNVTEISGTKPEMLITLADQKQISTRSVISTVSPTSTYNMVRDAEHTSLADLKETLIPVKGACLDIALKRLPVPQTTFALSIDAPMYFSNHSAVAKLSRNPGHVVVHAFKYLRSQVEQNPIQDRLEIEAFLDQIQPGWQKELITSRYLPSMTISHGLVTAERGRSYRKEETAVPDIPGLYITGDWLAKDGLLADASISSAKEAAMTMIQN
jgi:phytoene dehydrogenase-like protein